MGQDFVAVLPKIRLQAGLLMKRPCHICGWRWQRPSISLWTALQITKLHLRSNSGLSSISFIWAELYFWTGSLWIKQKYPASLARRSACASSCLPSLMPSLLAKILHSLPLFSQNCSASSLNWLFSLYRRPYCSFDPNARPLLRRPPWCIRSWSRFLFWMCLCRTIPEPRAYLQFCYLPLLYSFYPNVEN